MLFLFLQSNNVKTFPIGRYLAKHAPAVGATVKKSMDAGLNSGVS